MIGKVRPAPRSVSRIRYALRDGISAVFGKARGSSAGDRGWKEILPFDKYAGSLPYLHFMAPATDCILIGADALEKLSVSKSFSVRFYRRLGWGEGEG